MSGVLCPLFHVNHKPLLLVSFLIIHLGHDTVRFDLGFGISFQVRLWNVPSMLDFLSSCPIGCWSLLF